MTKISCREYNDSIIFTAEGHSGHGCVGSDIVCAGISTLVYTLLNTILDEASSDRIHLVRNVVRSGYIYLEFEMFNYTKERISGIIDACMTGFGMLEDNYPDAVKIE